jgi:hypothetical protein
MAYDLHIVKTESWLDRADDPITKAEVDALIASDSELAWSSADWMDMSDKKGKVTRYFAILWNGEPCFWWYRDEIRCGGPCEEQVAKMVRMANKLGANVIGDDDEVYR